MVTGAERIHLDEDNHKDHQQDGRRISGTKCCRQSIPTTSVLHLEYHYHHGEHWLKLAFDDDDYDKNDRDDDAGDDGDGDADAGNDTGDDADDDTDEGNMGNGDWKLW